MKSLVHWVVLCAILAQCATAGPPQVSINRAGVQVSGAQDISVAVAEKEPTKPLEAREADPKPPKPPKPKVVKELPTIVMPSELTVPVGRLKSVPISSTGDITKYTVIGEADAFREYNPDPAVIQLKLIGYTQGTAYVIAYCAMKDGQLSEPYTCKIVIGDPLPPNPPDPGPGPQPNPEPGKISVLIVDETEDYNKPEYRPYLPVLNSTVIRSYLDSHCATESGRPEWRHWDKDVDVTNASKKWQEAMKIPRTSLPWIAITNGVKGWAGPLPKTEAETLELLKKWGGN